MIQTGNETEAIARLDEGENYAFQVTGTWDGAIVVLEEWSEAAGDYVAVKTFTEDETFQRFVMGNRARFVGSSVGVSTALAVSHQRLRDAGTGATTPAALVTAIEAMDAGQAGSARVALEAQSSAVGFLNRFGRLANTTAVANGSTPEVGENVYMVWGAGSANPTVVNEALEAATGTLIYYGANVATPGHKISLTVWAELRLNAGYTSGTTAPDITFGINAKAWNSTLGLPGFLNSPQCFHGQVRTTGQVNANPYEEPPSINGDDGTAPFDAQLIGKKFPIRIEIDGTTDVCRMTVAGRTRVFRDSRYSRMVGTETSGFFVEWGAPDAATQYYWCVHTIAVNAPELEDSPTFEGGPYGVLLHDLQARGAAASLPGRIRVMNGAHAFNGSQAPASNDPLGVFGNSMLGHAPYGMPSPFIVSRLSGIIQRNTVALTSALNAADEFKHTIALMESLAAYTGANYAAGAFWKTTYIGRFGATASTNKRIKIVRPAGGFPPARTRFDSGDLTANGESFKLEHYEIRLAAGYIYVTILEWSDAAGLVKRMQTYNADPSNNISNQLLVSGTTAGDVTVDFHFTECHPVP